jgi:uncharacterized membrane protein
MGKVLDFLRGKWLKHPLHPALVHIPIAAWLGAAVCDLLSIRNIGGNVLVQLSYFAILVGTVVAVPTLITGLADFLEIKREKPAWKIGLTHGILNVIATGIFAYNLPLRWHTFRTAPAALDLEWKLSLAGAVLTLISSYLGGYIVYQHGIGVARFSKRDWKEMAKQAHANLPPEKKK